MAYGFLDIAMTPSVRAVQAKMGSEHIWSDFEGDRSFDRLSEHEIAFIAERDSFYMASVSETGWPYVQHRGGPKGFLRVLNEKTLAFADFRGNRQYISAGNLSSNGKACLFLMDYAQRARLKIFVTAEILDLEEDETLASATELSGYKARSERIFLLHVEAYDWNCPQHITPRFTQNQIANAARPLHERINALQIENAQLRRRLGEEGNVQ